MSTTIAHVEEDRKMNKVEWERPKERGYSQDRAVGGRMG
jgi:hypothetical protein